MTSAWDHILESPPESHVVQFCGDDEAGLVRNVSKYLSEGLYAGESALLVATASHTRLFLAELGAAARKVRCLDAHQTLARFVVKGMPDWELFQSVIGPEIEAARQSSSSSTARAYGEMVGVLWTAGRFAAAIRLEQFWNRLFSRSRFNLFCSYPIDVCGGDFPSNAMDAVLCNHTHLVPAKMEAGFESSLAQIIEEVLGGPMLETIRSREHPAWAAMPPRESLILSLRRHASDRAQEILALARRRLCESHAICA